MLKPEAQSLRAQSLCASCARERKEWCVLSPTKYVITTRLMKKRNENQKMDETSEREWCNVSKASLKFREKKNVFRRQEWHGEVVSQQEIQCVKYRNPR